MSKNKNSTILRRENPSRGATLPHEMIRTHDSSIRATSIALSRVLRRQLGRAEAIPICERLALFQIMHHILRARTLFAIIRPDAVEVGKHRARSRAKPQQPRIGIRLVAVIMITLIIPELVLIVHIQQKYYSTI